MITVVIPTYNENGCICDTVQELWRRDRSGLVQQIIISDGGSTDGTEEAARAEGVEVLRSPIKGRAAQMNEGARHATGTILYFLHADTLPPDDFTRDIANAIQKDFPSGCYRLSFDHPHWFLKANCWFTRFDVNAFRFGDQSLFVRKELFFQCGGFSEKLSVLEDQDMVKRLKNKGRFLVMDRAVVTSARKYLDNGIYKTQAIFFLIYFMYRLRFSQRQLVATYRKLVRQNKL